MVNQNCEYCFLETTSHSIFQKRVAPIEYVGTIFTIGAVCFTDTIPKENILELETLMTNFNRPEEAITLFCSMGLAGTEVAVANWLLE